MNKMRGNASTSSPSVMPSDFHVHRPTSICRRKRCSSGWKMAPKLLLQFCHTNCVIPSDGWSLRGSSSVSHNDEKLFWTSHCPRCQLSCQSHPILVTSQRNKSKVTNQDIICRIFCEIRNYRIKVLSPSTGNIYNRIIPELLCFGSDQRTSIDDSFPTFPHLACLKDQNSLRTFYQKFNELKLLNLSNTSNQFQYPPTCDFLI